MSEEDLVAAVEDVLAEYNIAPSKYAVLEMAHEIVRLRTVVAAALAFEKHVNDHGWARGLGYDCTITISATNGAIACQSLTTLLDAVRAYRAVAP